MLLHLFFSVSATRSEVLKSITEADIYSNSESSKNRKTKLKKYETRWIESYDANVTFKELYVFIINTFEHLQQDVNLETSCKASLNLNSIRVIFWYP